MTGINSALDPLAHSDLAPQGAAWGTRNRFFVSLNEKHMRAVGRKQLLIQERKMRESKTEMTPNRTMSTSTVRHQLICPSNFTRRILLTSMWCSENLLSASYADG
jgi:hypothetical protein